MDPIRRASLLSLAGLSIAGCARLSGMWRDVGGAENPQSLTPEYLDDLFLSDAEPEFFLRDVEPVPRWHQLDPKPPVQWASSAASPDFRHVGASLDGVTFRFDADVFSQLAEANGFALDPQSPTLFGLRGCALAAGVAFQGFAPSLLMKEVVPDHQSFRCVIGVIRPDIRQVWAANASTVPNVDYMYQCWKGGLNANMMPTGLHRYVVGPHNRGKSMSMQPGAFRQAKAVCVLRSKNDMSYNLLDDKWDFSRNVIVSDNIHAGVLDSTGALPSFSSAGCQTLPGSYTSARTQPTGVWARFREAAGLLYQPAITDKITGESTEDGREFSYLLLTGREARLASTGGAGALRRLRFGSSGPRVSALQRALAVRQTASFEQETMIALVQFQIRNGLFPDAIVSVDVASVLGVVV